MFLRGIIFGVVFFLGMSSMLPTLAVNQNSLSNEFKFVVTTLNETDDKLTLLSDLIEYRIKNAAAILEFTSRLPEMGDLFGL
ncbi:hypothetical protein BH18THE1_BH18THE1_22510 [soil metagenome]